MGSCDLSCYNRAAVALVKFKAPRYIAIEGPIRVGKSTLARALAENFHARRIFDCEDNPFLRDFYDEKPGSGFRAQMYFLYERHRRLIEARPEDSAAPLVADFLFQKDKIFAYINLDNEELKMYEKYFDMLAPSVAPPDLVIYLQAKPEVLRKRLSKKADPAETQISPEYLEAVANAYEHFFFRYAGSNLLVVDTSDIDFVERNQDLQELLRRLRQPVKGTQYFLPLGQ
jgi:deoxyadenosine/deoxycytidine kinase